MLKAGTLMKIATFTCWVIVVPPGLFFLWSRAGEITLERSVLVPAALLAMAAVYFPITRNGVPLSLAVWLTLPAFLLEGIFVEAVLMQIAVLGAIPGNRKSPDSFHRFFFNSLMFFALSVLSGSVFYFAGGVERATGLMDLILPAAVYLAVHTIGNFACVRLYQKLNNQPRHLRTGSARQDFMAAFVVLPYALSAYYLYLIIGPVSLPLLAVPFFSGIFLVRLYDTAERINRTLTKAVALGHEMSGKLTQPEVLDLFKQKVPVILPVDRMQLFDVFNGRIEPLKMSDEGDEGVGSMIYRSQNGRLFGRREEWIVYSDGSAPSDIQSVLGVHIIRNKAVVGVLSLMSKRPYAYGEYHLRVMELLGSYLAVALEKAKHVQNTVRESEHCGLTGLYNYGYMERKLHQLIGKVNDGEIAQLSCMMFDIDHFKQVNDQHGHHGGNAILVEFAQLLQEVSETSWTVARYGGEEFIILMPGVGKDQAIRCAEDIRQRVEHHLFFHDREEPGTKEIPITVSVGVASAPADGESAMSLIRNADRALYTGAKQDGRNKVAAYTG